MKAKMTVTAKKTWTEEYPDNNFSEEVIADNFWSQTYNQDEFLKKAKLEIKRVDK
jgi:hypothetical protein